MESEDKYSIRSNKPKKKISRDDSDNEEGSILIGINSRKVSEEKVIINDIVNVNNKKVKRTAIWNKYNDIKKENDIKNFPDLKSVHTNIEMNSLYTINQNEIKLYNSQQKQQKNKNISNKLHEDLSLNEII